MNLLGGVMIQRARNLGFAVVFVSCCWSPAISQTQMWVRQFGTSVGDVAYGAAPDGSGGVFMCGGTAGSLGAPSAGAEDAWISRHDSTGGLMWLRQVGANSTDWAQAVAGDGSGGAFACGSTTGSLGGAGVGSYDAWIARFDGLGNQLWIRQLGTSADDKATGLAVDGNGGVFITGSTEGSLGGPGLGSIDAWVARYDGGGAQLWIRQFGSTTVDVPYGAAIDGLGGVYLSGYTDGSLGGTYLGGGDVWLARYDGGGNQTWIRQFGTTTSEYAYGVSPDGSGGAYICGETYGAMSGPTAGSWDAWLARFDLGGTQLWIKQFGTYGEDYAYAPALDATGGVYLSGGTEGSLGGQNIGVRDAWVAKHDPTGSQTWVRQLGTGTVEGAFAAASDGAGGVFLGGYTDGYLGGPPMGAYDAWLARYSGGPPPPASFCAAKINSLGCQPAIGWTGSPTLGGLIDDFHVGAASVLNRKPGIMLWSMGPGSTPLGGGTLCLAPPVIRTPGQNSGGSAAPVNDCTGVYDFHFGHAYAQSYFLTVGQTVYAQYWSRDPGFPAPNNIGLTDGLRFTLLP